MTGFIFELAVSAVSFDAALVAELFTSLCLRLRTEPVWDGHVAGHGPVFHRSLVADRSRLAMVLHQRLWQHDDATRDDAVLLRERMRLRPQSVCVLALDDAPVPDWLAGARRCDFASAGLQGAANFALDAIEACGGAIRPAPPPPEAQPVRRPWEEGGAPFLSQPRAQSALRHQLDAMAAELALDVERRRAAQPGSALEMHVHPNRLVARLGHVGISFSWVGGRAPSVAEGRLLVIQWDGVAVEARGIAALKSASPVRERVYRPEAADAEHWRWRVDDDNGRAYSTDHLVGEWLAGSSIQQST